MMSKLSKRLAILIMEKLNIDDFKEEEIVFNPAVAFAECLINPDEELRCCCGWRRYCRGGHVLQDAEKVSWEGDAAD